MRLRTRSELLLHVPARTQRGNFFQVMSFYTIHLFLVCCNNNLSRHRAFYRPITAWSNSLISHRETIWNVIELFGGGGKRGHYHTAVPQQSGFCQGKLPATELFSTQTSDAARCLLTGYFRAGIAPPPACWRHPIRGRSGAGPAAKNRGL